MEERNQQLEKENEELKQLVLVQSQQIDYLKRQLFGSKSEKVDANQEELSLEDFADELGKPEAVDGTCEPEAAVEKKETKNNPRKQRSDRMPQNLPEVIEEIIPQEVSDAPEEWRRMDADEYKQLEKEPGYFYIRRTVRPKFVRIDQPFKAPVQSLAPKTLVKGSFMGDTLLSEILCNRYLYALPFYRQSQMYSQRYGIDISRSSMSDAAQNVSSALEPIYEEMKKQLLAGSFIGCDETPIKYLDKENGGSKQGYYWVYRSTSGEVLFDWRTNREHSNLEAFLGMDYEGILQSDGYEAYKSYCKKSNVSKRAACLAHIRRKFEQAKNYRSEIVSWFLKIIARLYKVEKDLKAYQADPETRSRIRKNLSSPYIRMLEKAARHFKSKRAIHSQTNFGKALTYACNHLPDMYVYLDHGEVEIDNNLVENAIRPTAVGKKNHLFVGAAEAGGKSALLYSLLLSAKALGVPPQEYLLDVMKRLPQLMPDESDAIVALTPARWAEAWHTSQKLLKAQPTAA